MDYEQTSKIFKAFCDPNRVQIFHILQNGEKCACHLLDMLHIGQSTLSHHMKILCDSGVVVGRKEGKWTHYSISPEGAAYAAKCLRELTSINGATVDGDSIYGIPADGNCDEPLCR